MMKKMTKAIRVSSLAIMAGVLQKLMPLKSAAILVLMGLSLLQFGGCASTAYWVFRGESQAAFNATRIDCEVIPGCGQGPEEPPYFMLPVFVLDLPISIVHDIVTSPCQYYRWRKECGSSGRDAPCGGNRKE